MLDYRAWIAAGLILVSAGGAYLFWLHRTRAMYAARSLTGPARRPDTPNQPLTDTLHIEGCEKNYIVKHGEVVEPRAVPGSPLDRFRNVYGKETKREDRGILNWDEYAFTLKNGYFGPDNPGNFVGISVNGGHVVQTLDGIELGIDSFGTIFRKLRDQNIAVHERIDGGEGNWTLTVSFYSACGPKFRSEYSRTLPRSPDLDNLIQPKTKQPKGVDPEMWRSDIFLNKVAFDYALVPSDGQDDSTSGNPSEHQ